MNISLCSQYALMIIAYNLVLFCKTQPVGVILNQDIHSCPKPAIFSALPCLALSFPNPWLQTRPLHARPAMSSL